MRRVRTISRGQTSADAHARGHRRIPRRAPMNATTAPRRRLLAPMLAALAMFGPFSIDTIFPAFPAISAQLHASPFAMQQTVSVYLIAYALMSLLHGPVSDALGRRRVILVGVVVFTLASVGCALSGSIAQFVMARIVQRMREFERVHDAAARVDRVREQADLQRPRSRGFMHGAPR
jgi:DHA1 family bicyclomycin/chloramphenicol resistance-like MFS transporter